MFLSIIWLTNQYAFLLPWQGYVSHHVPVTESDIVVFILYSHTYIDVDKRKKKNCYLSCVGLQLLRGFCWHLELQFTSKSGSGLQPLRTNSWCFAAPKFHCAERQCWFSCRGFISSGMMVIFWSSEKHIMTTQNWWIIIATTLTESG